MRTTHFILGAIISIGLIFSITYFLQSENGESPDILSSTQPMTKVFSITSSVFEHNGMIPAKYTCDGDRKLSPPLTISGVPEGAKALVLIMDDPDVPKALRPDGVFDHWVVFNIPVDTKEIPEGGSVPGVAGANGGGKNSYTGPCPPPQYEPSEHRYVFKLYALSATLVLEPGATKVEVLDALAPLKLAEAELIGRYSRK